ncbi:ribosomal L1 domain-containing protein 1 [Vigna radiata var. radiata]|uniref:Ribosomal L1 domain-containing protein 1 n=1 Tax=Vigna radiata var. radiata TaxID=3916 RepID=A0A1S3TYL7_VIGRR|nr:ribosomal L1 domain-containing protein 1 [Vigna radiata var. radiata]
MASENLNPVTVTKAIDALLKWRRSQSETQKPKLFDQDEEFVYLVVTLKKIPAKSRVNPYKIPLPHSLFSQFSEQCLILDDRPNKARVTKAQAQAKVQSESIPIAKILKLSKLASDYRAFEAKRKLCDSYDLFFAEKNIVPLLPRLLGKQFFKKRKLPVPVDLKKSNWKEQVERACSSAMLFMRTGTCSVVRVAKVGMERDSIVENVMAAVEGIVEVVPKKWGNVRSLHLKLLESVALPVYQVVPDLKLRIEGANEQAEIKEKKKKRKNDEEVRESAKKKGRIHEVRYMDENGGEDEIENELTSDDGGGDDNVDEKRKRGVSSVLNGEKRLKKSSGVKEKRKKGKSESELVAEDKESSAKDKKKKVKSGSELVIRDEESGVKKTKKGELKKMKTGEVKVKAVKSVKAKKSKKA